MKRTPSPSTETAEDPSPASGRSGGRRPPVLLLAVVTALVAVTGVASLAPAEEDDGGGATSTRRIPVERTTLTCPRPTGAEKATTVYTAFSAGDGEAGGTSGGAELLPAPEHTPGGIDEPDDDEESADADEADEAEPADAEAVLPLEEVGVPVSVSTKETGLPALSGTAQQGLAPGWTVQQTTLVTSGVATGLMGTSCQAPDTEFWFAGASTAESRQDYLHLTNPDEAATVVDIELYGAGGRLESGTEGEGITVPGQSSVPVRLSTLAAEAEADLVARVSARGGRVGAQIEAVDTELGTDWLAPISAPAGGPAVMPGIPADAENVRLVAFTPGDEDVSVDVEFAGPTGTITPAGSETIHLNSGTLTAVDLGDITMGEAGSLILTPKEGSANEPVVATLRVTRGDEDEGTMAFIPAAAPVERRASATGNTVKGTELTLVAPGEAVEVDITVSAGSDGGAPVSESHTVSGRTTLTLPPEVADDTEGRYTITVNRVSGGDLYASRTLTLTRDDVPLFTVQPLPDDRSSVALPEAGQDLTVLMD